MNHAEIVREYLNARRGEELVADSFPFVTIAREAGAGGRSLGAEVVKRIQALYPGTFGEGWEVFDQNLCGMIAENTELGISIEQLLHEEYRSGITQTVSDLIAQRAQRYEAYKRVFEVIRILATLGKAVIVGRAGVCVTADMPLGVRIRLVAPPEQRVRRMMEILGTTEAEARAAMEKQDADRKRLARDFFDKNLEDPLLYDAVFNTGSAPIPEIAEFVARLVKQKWESYKSNRRHSAI